MQVSVTPSSGYDNSYYDIQYNITFDKDIPDSEFKLYFINVTNNERLNILATSTGHINSEGYAVITEPKNKLEGYINLFNDDKMNVQLETHKQIELKCVIESENNRIKKEILFFNESYSADQSILPFELYVENKIIDLAKQEPLRLIITADNERSFHLIVTAVYSRIQYDFYIFTKKGQISIEVPAEVLNHELNLYKTSNVAYHICYMKQHGVNYNNVVNEKKVIIPETEIKFVNSLELLPQTRYNPVQKELSYTDFIPSDRYFVPTLPEYSFYSKFKVDIVRDFYSSLLTNEFVHFRYIYSRNPKLPSDKFWGSEKRRSIKEHDEPNSRFYSTMSSIYTNITNKTAPYAEQLKLPGQLGNVNSKGGDCAECGRKRKRNSQNQ